jgi:hypothetical protein
LSSTELHNTRIKESGKLNIEGTWRGKNKRRKQEESFIPNAKAREKR